MSDVLTLVVRGAPLAERTHEVARSLMNNGWRVSVVASPAARAWLDEAAVESVVGHRSAYQQREAKQLRNRPRPSSVVVCPLTLNSGSKAAAGVMDTYATGVLCEALASRTPLTAVLMVSNRLWGHPAWSGHLRTIGEAGVKFVSLPTGMVGTPEPVESGSGPEVVSNFDPEAFARIVGAPPRNG